MGMAGVLCRYGVDQFFLRGNEGFPWSTLAVNILGSFLAGCIYAVSTYRDLSSTLQVALLVGFCGGFTTFSAYALQSLLLLERGKVVPALAYFFFSPVAALSAALLPVLVAKRLWG